MKEFNDWCGREAARIGDELRAAAMAGDFSRVVWFIPACPGTWARTVLAHPDARPDGATEVLRWPGVGDRVASVPYAEIARGLIDSCARLPVYPGGSPV
jgi:hypothetical protein